MRKTYATFSGKDLEIAEKIQQRRLQMLVHSCLYYNMNTNLITDRQWDMWAKELRNLQNTYPEISRQVEWYAEFADWDASTGAFLPLDDPWVIRKANQLRGVRTAVNKPTKKEKPKESKQLSLF